MPALPSDLQTLIDAVDAADREADAIASGLSERQFHWQPDGGRAWGVALCLDHLATANRVYGDALLPGIERARAQSWTRQGPIASTFWGRWFISSLEPPVKRRMVAPTKIRPAARGSRDEILAAYHDAHRRVRGLIETCATLDVNRATFTNPFISWVKVRVGTGFRIMAAHDRRHLWQARRVLERPDFPR